MKLFVVCHTLCKVLHFPLYRFVQSFNRMNLKYSVQQKKGKSCLTEIATLIKAKFKKCSGIVYCLSRKECDKVRPTAHQYSYSLVYRITIVHLILHILNFSPLCFNLSFLVLCIWWEGTTRENMKSLGKWNIRCFRMIILKLIVSSKGYYLADISWIDGAVPE